MEWNGRQFFHIPYWQFSSIPFPFHTKSQRWSRAHKARGQGQGHKKIRGQGQPFRGQTLSRPWTGMLEAKDTAASVLQKKGLQKSFSGNLQCIGVAGIFDWGGLNHKPHAMTSSKICLLALNQDFGKGRGLKLI